MRLVINKIVLLLSTLSAVVGLGFLFWILITLTIKGIGAIDLHIFTNDLVNNGLRNLLVGQFILALIAVIIGVPIGMIAGIYLQEYSFGSKYAEFIRNLSDVMMSAPSIVIGTFVYAIVVNPIGHQNGWAGAIALAIMMIPIVVRTTDDMLGLVPKELREAGVAIGAPKYKVIFDIIIKAAKVGIMTGILLAFARIVGETAPLLFTSGNSEYFTLNLNDTFPSLTVAIYNLATMPDVELVRIAWAGAFILTLFVLIINLLGRYIIKDKK
ncbi:phosphate ABC transporter, permease protein PstA [Nautilia profundicola AmH]|uniref:Phosphate transport system permease protein PstA n=1 Tax=Nautilia profundicola (strain ATCC BAA-1463 / DSM 18972 / AmH) TaxID=598659 RepID=B9L7X5_NAUPA|nr:phosphate ABC transporter permease PstA [Nautilia profundicola]ACM93445.1 phosphate ABC transporter, permease protein PstA [Nautilia profundicola AmH]